MRAKLLAVVAAVMVVVGIGVLPSTAAANTSDCPAGFVCVWEGPTFGGQRSQWAGSETGTKTLENIDPRSAYNHTGNHTAVLNQWYEGCCPNLILQPGKDEGNRPTPYGGDLIIS
jgi:hypothetical protein